jgi:hypothetical protein
VIILSDLNQDKLLSGVKCTVENCVHHTQSNGCTASGITVGGHDANAVKETGCETFCKKGHCN